MNGVPLTVEVPKFISENEIADYLPHRGKMLLLSRITNYDMEKRIITGEYDITENCIFYEKEGDGAAVFGGASASRMQTLIVP